MDGGTNWKRVLWLPQLPPIDLNPRECLVCDKDFFYKCCETEEEELLQGIVSLLISVAVTLTTFIASYHLLSWMQVDQLSLSEVLSTLRCFVYWYSKCIEEIISCVSVHFKSSEGHCKTRWTFWMKCIDVYCSNSTSSLNEYVFFYILNAFSYIPVIMELKFSFESLHMEIAKLDELFEWNGFLAITDQPQYMYIKCV